MNVDFKNLFTQLYSYTEIHYENFVKEKDEITQYVYDKLYFSHYESLMYLVKKSDEMNEDCGVELVLKKDKFEFLKERIYFDLLCEILHTNSQELKEYFSLKVFNKMLRKKIENLYQFVKDLEVERYRSYNSIISKCIDKNINDIYSWSKLNSKEKRMILESLM